MSYGSGRHEKKLYENSRSEPVLQRARSRPCSTGWRHRPDLHLHVIERFDSMRGLRGRPVALEEAPRTACVQVPSSQLRSFWLHGARRDARNRAATGRRAHCYAGWRAPASGFLAPPRTIAQLAAEIRTALQAGMECGEIALLLSGGNPLAGTAAATVCGGLQMKGYPVQETINALVRIIERFVSLSQ